MPENYDEVGIIESYDFYSFRIPELGKQGEFKDKILKSSLVDCLIRQGIIKWDDYLGVRVLVFHSEINLPAKIDIINDLINKTYGDSEVAEEHHMAV